MAVKRQLSATEYRNKLIAKFWVLAKEIGKDYAYECAASLYPDKVTTLPNSGISQCSIEELGGIVHELSQKTKKSVGQRGQVGRVGQVGQRKKIEEQKRRREEEKKKQKTQPTGKPVVIGEWAKPATAYQTGKINDLAYELKISDEYLLGVLKKANGGKDLQDDMSVGLAQNVIEALKAMRNHRSMFNDYKPIKKRK